MKKRRIFSLLIALVLIISFISIVLSAFSIFNLVAGIVSLKKTEGTRSTDSVSVSWDENPFYVYFKKHYCPLCGTKLKTSYYSVIVNSDSPEAKNYDFSSDDGELTGDVEFRTMCFKCPKCEIKISFDEMKRLEKQQKLSP